MKRLLLSVFVLTTFAVHIVKADEISRLQNEIERLDNDIQIHQQFLVEQQNNLNRAGSNAAARTQATKSIQQLMQIIREKENKRKGLLKQYDEEVNKAVKSRGQKAKGA